MTMSKATAERPRLAGLNFLVEAILSNDDDGKVVRISDKAMPGKLYALKLVNREDPDDDPKLERCRAAVEASEKLGLSTILKYHDYRDRKSWFRLVRGELLMEHVDGKSLDALEGKPAMGQWILIFKHITEALAHMHRRGVLHGDLNPRRVLLARSGAVKVLGYGQSLLKDKKHRTISKQFAASEQVREKVLDEKTDIYSVGALMYFLLTGKSPNALKNREDDVTVKLPNPSALNPKVPAALDDVILPCIQRHPESRPEGMYDVLKGLEDLARKLKLNDAQLQGLAKRDENESSSS
jgi:serine/threonine-protein kinase